jgi:hypothetical protein
MAAKIYKYPLEITDLQLLRLPAGYRILSVGLDGGGEPAMWAVVDPDEKAGTFLNVWVVGTGNPADELDPSWQAGWSFVGTITMPPFVWHVFAQVNLERIL